MEKATMAPFSQEDELEDDGALDLLVEIPLVTTRKHIDTGSPEAEDFLLEHDGDYEDLTLDTLTVVSSPPNLLGSLLDFNPCSAVVEHFASCSIYPTTRARSDAMEYRTCNGCNRIYHEIKFYTRETAVVENKMCDIDECGEDEFDVAIDTGAETYCYECAEINQGRVDHQKMMKSIMVELLARLDDKEVMDGNETELESRKIPEEDIVEQESTRTKKRLSRKSLKKIMKNTFSSLRKLTSEVEEDTKEDTEDYSDNEEEYYDTIHDIATIYSSPTSLHYRFDNNSINGDDATNMKRKLSSLIVRAKKAYTSINRRTNSVHDMTQVRAVAVLWR